MKTIVSIAATLLLLSHCAMAEKTGTNWSKEQLEIIELNRWVPLAAKEAGYKAYTDLFHPEYTNWYMAGDKESLRTREQFLTAVKGWFEAGNYATFSKVEPISVEVFGDLAYVRYVQEEHFHHPDQPATKFVGHFASLMKKHKGKWTFYRTSFQDRFRGPLEQPEDSD